MDSLYKPKAFTTSVYRSIVTILLLMLAVMSISDFLLAPERYLASPEPTNQSFIRLSNTQPVVPNISKISYLPETDPISENDLAALSGSEWLPITRPNMSLGTSDNAIWYRIPVSNLSQLATEQVLNIQWPNLYSVDLYKYDTDSSSFEINKRGLNTTQAPSQSFKSPTPSFTFSLAPHESTILLLRVHTHYVQYVPMTFWPTELYSSHLEKKVIGYTAAFGALIAMLIFNSLLFIKLRSRTYAFYSVYIFCIIFYQLCVSGYGPNLLWSNNLQLKLKGYELSAYLSFLFSSIFIRYFLQLKNTLRLINSVIIGYWAFATACLLLNIQIPTIFSETAATISCIAGFITGYYSLVQKHRNAIYFCIAWTFLLLSTIALLLMVKGFIAYSPLIEYGQILGFVIEVLTLSLALVGSLHYERSNRIAAQANALQLSQQVNDERAAKLQAHQDLLTTKSEHNALLEQKVIQRTQELEVLTSKLETANKQLSKMSLTDPLTGLHNRRFLDQNLEATSNAAVRAGGTLSMLLIDIDFFKAINDTHGHLAGDTCLIRIAQILKNNINRATDSIARYGGEEFAIILPGTKEADLILIAEKIRKEVEECQIHFNGQTLKLTISIGCGTVRPSEFIPPKCLIALTDKALYRAKNNGRNRCECSFNI